MEFSLEIPQQQGGNGELVFEPSYAQALDGLLQLLRKYYDYGKSFGGDIHFGPVYHVRSSGEIGCRIQTVYAKNKASEIVDYTLIATDENNHMVGYRTSSVFSEKDYYDVTGYIYTAIRAKGVATAIDSAHVDFLKRFFRSKVKWHISNSANVRSGEEIARWKHLYGIGGVFGRGIGGYVTIEPFNDSDSQAISDVYLSRTSNGKFVAGTIRSVSVDEKHQIDSKNMLMLELMTR